MKKIFLILLIFLFIFLIFLNLPFKDKIISNFAKNFIKNKFNTQVDWENFKISFFLPHILIENIKFKNGKIERLVIFPSFKFAKFKVFISGLDVFFDLEKKEKPEQKKKKYNFVFIEDLVLKDSFIRFKDLSLPLEGFFKGIFLIFWKRDGILNIKEVEMVLPEVGKINFSFKSIFKFENNFCLIKSLLINSKDFYIKGNGKIESLEPSFLFSFKLKSKLKKFLDFLNLGIDGNLDFIGALNYKNELNIYGSGKIIEPFLLNKKIKDLELYLSLNEEKLKLNFFKDKNEIKIDLSFDEKKESNLNFELEGIKLKEILSFFDVSPPNYNAQLKINGNYSFFGTNVEKGSGKIEFFSKGKSFKGSGEILNLSLLKINAFIKEEKLNLNLSSMFPFNSSEKFFLKAEILNSNMDRIVKIISPFILEIPDFNGSTNGVFEMSGKYDDFKISANLSLRNFYIEELLFGDGEVSLSYEKYLKFEKINFKKGEGLLNGTGDTLEGIKYFHKDWPFEIPVFSKLTGYGKVIFDPEFKVLGKVENGNLENVCKFEKFNFNYEYDGKKLKIFDLEGFKENGILKMEAEYEEKLKFNLELYEFPLKLFKAYGNFYGVYGDENIFICGNGFLKHNGLEFPYYISLNNNLFEIRAGNGNISLNGNGFLDNELNFRGSFSFLFKSFPFFKSLNFEPELKGELNINGNLKKIKEISGNIKIDPFNLLLMDTEFEFGEGIDFELKNGEFSFLDTPVYHKFAYIETSGKIRIFPSLFSVINLSADFGDEIVSHFLPDFEYNGMASLNLKALIREDLKIDGKLNISGYSFLYKPINFYLKKPEGKILIKENKIEIQKISGYSGDGNLILEGEAIFKNILKFERIYLKARGKNLKISYPEGFKMILDGQAEFIWSDKLKRINGDLLLKKGLYNKEINILAQIQKLITPSKFEVKTKEFPEIELNLNLEIPSSLKVKNQMLNLTCTGKLQFSGKISNPVILGYLETLPKSEIYFNGVQYEVKYAKALLNDPEKFDPFIEAEAFTNIRFYLISLKLRGTLSYLTPQFSSEPYLPESDIISLLATGKVASQESGTWLSGTSLLISHQISEELSKQTSSIFGIDRIRIEPVFGKTQISTAKLTALKQISPNCTLSYTYNPIEHQKDIISLECNISQNTFINLMQEEDGTYSIQIFQRKNF